MRCEACGADPGEDYAEIERLKSLIIELAYELDEYVGFDNACKDLIRRAREAIK